MSSNPPPPITPNTNTNADFSPDGTPTAPTVPVVTQASQLAHEFDLVSTPTDQRRNRNNLREAFLDIQEEEYIREHANLQTTPIMAPSTVAHFPTPTNALPNTSKKRIHSMMDSATMNNIDRATAAQEMVSLASSSSKKRCNLKGTLLTFLRQDDFTNQASQLESKRKANNESIINTSISKALMVQHKNN